MRKVLILDGNQRSALAVTRSLGSKGRVVVTADQRQSTLSGSSKYCAESFVYPSPYNEPENFVKMVRNECSQRDIGIIIPMTEITTYLMLKNRHLFNEIVIPYGDFEAYEFLSDKWRVCELAGQLGISHPKTYFVKSASQICDSLSEWNFPLIIKPYRSLTFLDGKGTPMSVKCVRSSSELYAAIERTHYLQRCPFLLQEYVEGEGRGIFVLYERGTPVVYFAHRRLREKPPSGGVSVLSESIEVDSQLREAATKLLDHVKWHGVAMVEFKVSPAGTPYLIEINPRLWGSLQLAIDAGIDFGDLLCKLALGENLDIAGGYKVGVRSRWLLGDLDHLYLTFKEHSHHDNGRASMWKKVLDFLNFSGKNCRFDVNRWEDLNPFICELRQYLLHR